MEVKCNYCNWVGQEPSSAAYESAEDYEAAYEEFRASHDDPKRNTCPITPEREAGIKFAREIQPIESAHDAVATSLKSLFNSVLFNVKDTRLNHRLRKEIEEIQQLHYTELKLITSVLRNHYVTGG